MYETSEIKDVNIKQIERLVKEASIDCALTYKRNYTQVMMSKENVII